MKKKELNKKQAYEAPLLLVEEVLLEDSFLGGSHESYGNPDGSHETMEETDDSFKNDDFSFI